MKLSNASQPTCTSTSGEVHRVYVYITCPDTGTPLSCLNIVIICVCVCVCVCVCMCVCMFVCVIVCFCICANVYATFCYFLSICEHSNLYLPSFPLCVP